ncbi:AAA-type ATPase lid domain-containing protein [Paenibacillus sp. BAC0078]
MKEEHMNDVFTEQSLIEVYDDDGNVLLTTLQSNIHAEAKAEMLSRLPLLRQGREVRIRKKINRSIWEIKGLRLSVRGICLNIFLFEKLGPGRDPNDYSIRFENEKDWSSSKDFIWFDQSAAIEEVIAQIKRYGQSMSPVFIVGEIGTGKNIVANELYKACLMSKNHLLRHKPMMIVDCILMTGKKWRWLLENTSSAFMEVGHIIYIKNVEVLSVPFIKQMHEYFKDGDFYSHNKVIFSYSCRNSDEEPDEICRLFANNMGCLKLQLPTLRSRKADIPHLVKLCREEMNGPPDRAGVDFEQAALEAMQEFNWKDNLEQLKRVVEELTLNARGPRITKEEVEATLRKESQRPERSISGVDVNQTLDVITKDIISLVLQEENMNHSKAAKRLGISRSTMWRKLNGN